MAKLRSSEIAGLIKQQIASYQTTLKTDSVGTVIRVGDGIAIVHGLDDAMSGELLDFGSDIFGMVLNLEQDQVGVIILSQTTTIKECDTVRCTGLILEVPVGEELLGRVVNSLGIAIDGKPAIVVNKTRAVEQKASGVMARQSVFEPMQTGIKVLDALVPIGRGQRELIIGDRQTGKTSIAIDTIMNQKDQDVICIYVAIGQKESTVRNVVEVLEAAGAMPYTIVISASSSLPAPMLYLAPYAGVTMAEEFMYAGKHVLIIYDDLSKHAVAYRELSLLLRRPPGREAFPGDVFYLHSRLLERASKLSDEFGGGSITALPIIETKEGDISAYIPTNVISITDGQIFLQTSLFYSGIRPAIDAGNSVSRVGGAAQTKAIKKVSGTLRLNLASYRELEAFTQFGSDLDESTKTTLERGRRTVEILKQGLHENLTVGQMTFALASLKDGYLDQVKIEDVRRYESDLYSFLETDAKAKALKDSINKTGQYPAEDDVKDVLTRFSRQFS
jgi:F-type H+-transporting ATPase subunit alpha